MLGTARRCFLISLPARHAHRVHFAVGYGSDVGFGSWRSWTPAGVHACSLPAGSAGRGIGWLQAMPTHHRLRASAATYSIALALRLGAAVPGLLGVRCGGCGEVLHDAWGRHPSACQKGNRGSLWDLRHLSLQDALLWVLRTLARCPSAQVARGNVLGSAAVTGVRADGSLSYRQLDLWVPHYVAPGRHMGIDVAVTDPLAVTALRSSPSSSAESGRAATLRAEKKVAKYERIMLSVGGVFRAGVVERFGAVGDSLAGLVRMTVGDAARMGDEGETYFPIRFDLLSYLIQYHLCITRVSSCIIFCACIIVYHVVYQVVYQVPKI